MTSSLRFRAQLVRWRPAHRSPAPPPARSPWGTSTPSRTPTHPPPPKGVSFHVGSGTRSAQQGTSPALSERAKPPLHSPQVEGDTINFSYKITNTGNVTLSGVVLIDASLPGFETPGGICGGKTTFSPGASITCSGIYM